MSYVFFRRHDWPVITIHIGPEISVTQKCEPRVQTEIGVPIQCGAKIKGLTSAAVPPWRSIIFEDRWKTSNAFKIMSTPFRLLDANLMQTTLSTLVTWSDSCKPCITYKISWILYLQTFVFRVLPTSFCTNGSCLSKTWPFCRDVETHAGAGSWETSGWLQPLPPWLSPKVMISWWFDHWWILMVIKLACEKIFKNHQLLVINFQSWSHDQLVISSIFWLVSWLPSRFPASPWRLESPGPTASHFPCQALGNVETFAGSSHFCPTLPAVGGSSDLSYRLARHLKDLGILLQPTPAAIVGPMVAMVAGRFRSHPFWIGSGSVAVFRSTKSLLRNWGQIWGLDCHGQERPMACHGMLKMTKI